MEAFTNFDGESHIVVGSRPKNASESLNRLELAKGKEMVLFQRECLGLISHNTRDPLFDE